MASKKEKTSLLPEVRQVQVGIREVRTENMYPLSLNDQFELADQITEVLSYIMDLESSGALKEADETDKDQTMGIIQSLLSSLHKSIPFILEKCFDDVTMSDVTNNQMIDIAYNLFDVNYKDLSKNLKDLFKKKAVKMDQATQA
jgi:hypothetical protein